MKTTYNCPPIAKQRQEQTMQLIESNQALQAEQEESLEIINELKTKLADVEKRVAELDWRSVSVKPTKEDGDADGYVRVTNGKTEWGAPFDDLTWNGECTHWMPFIPLPVPTPEEKSRAEFEEAWRQFPNKNNLSYNAPNGSLAKEAASYFWQIARKEKS